MAAEMYDSKEGNIKPTQGVGNANGKPIRPILFGVAAVIALILVSLAMSRKPEQANSGSSEAGPIPTAQYSPASTSDTALGQRSQGSFSDSASRPATGPMSGEGADTTSVSGSSSLPVPGPKNAPGAVNSSAGQNFVAPPGPAANQQESNR